jgi:hypothetical protein
LDRAVFKTSRLGPSKAALRPPPWGLGRSEPLIRFRRRSFFNHSMLTQKRAAISFCVPVPDSYAATTFSRRSREYGFINTVSAGAQPNVRCSSQAARVKILPPDTEERKKTDFRSLRPSK